MKNLVVSVMLCGFFWGCSEAPSAGGATTQALVQSPRVISVSGSATEEYSPNEAKISLFIEHVSKNSQQSREQVISSANRVIKAMVDLDVEEEAMSKSNISQGKKNEWRNSQRVDLGYFSRMTLKVKVSSMDALPKIYDALSRFNEVQVNQTSFDRSDRKLLEAALKKEAILDAKAKAESMLAVLDEKIGAVLSVTDAGAPVHRPMMMADNFEGATRSAMKVGSDEIAYGDINLRANVHLVFEIR